MKKLYSLFAVAMIAASVNAQTSTITINTTSAGGTAVLGSAAYNSGAERNWAINGVNFGGKAITGNQTNSPVSGTAQGSVFQLQANNGVIYNTSALPGRIVSVTLNYTGTAQVSSLFGGNTSRLVNSSAADYTVTGGTQVGTATSTGWTSSDFTGTNYTFFALKRGSGTSYISSIEIVYENPALAVGDVNTTKTNLVKNTVVANNIVFAAKTDVQVISANGQVVKTASVTENSSVDVSSLPNGMYIVTGSVNGEAVSQKIIKK